MPDPRRNARNRGKAAERRIAGLFGTRRTPLSGSNSAHTASDTLHPELFIEVKSYKRQAVQSLYDKTRTLAAKEKKLPILALHQTNRQGALIVVHESDLDTFADLIRRRVDGVDESR